MKRSPMAATVMLAASMVAPAAAQDFYIPPPSTVDSSTMIMTRRNVEHQRQMDHILRGSRSGSEPDSTIPGNAIPGYIQQRVESASFSILNPEFNRRVSAYGKNSAQQWLNSTARSIGGEMGRLGPEYLQRASNQGRARADAWYVAQARAISQRHVADGGR
ncbi:MAG: hypothetical protein QM761_03360 [Pseudoxanthomonas sp.]